MADRHIGGERLSAFLDDELVDELALDLTRHVSGCERCRHELESLRATRAALRRLPDLLAPVLTHRATASRPVLRQLPRRLRWTGVAVAAVTALVGVAYAVGDEGDVVPPVELFLVDHLARTGGGPVPGPVGTPDR